MRIQGTPLAIGADGSILARFADPYQPTRYQRGMMWVGLDAAGRVCWTEGLRTVEGSNAVDVENLTTVARDVYDRSVAAHLAGGAYPVLVLP